MIDIATLQVETRCPLCRRKISLAMAALKRKKTFFCLCGQLIRLEAEMLLGRMERAQRSLDAAATLFAGFDIADRSPPDAGHGKIDSSGDSISFQRD